MVVQMVADQVSIFANGSDPFPTVEPYSAERDYDAWLAEAQAEEVANLRNEASFPPHAAAALSRLRELLPEPDYDGPDTDDGRDEWEHPSERWPEDGVR